METIEIVFTGQERQWQDNLIAVLSENGFEGFEEAETELKAYITKSSFQENIVTNIANELNVAIKQITTLAPQNWNAIWESNFEPLIVPNCMTGVPFIGIRAYFHEPLHNVAHELVITPKMSFGTGHHPTTFLMMQLMQLLDFSSKSVFDFGTGTGILAILAEKLGAKYAVAVDNDDWCVENATENIQSNNCSNIVIAKAYNAQQSQNFDIVIANVNKNIIKDNVHFLAKTTKSTGYLLLSGLLATDKDDVLSIPELLHFSLEKFIEKDGWIALLLKAY